MSHLDTTQLSMVAARARKIYDDQAKERQESLGKNHGEDPSGKFTGRGDSRDAAGKAIGFETLQEFCEAKLKMSLDEVQDNLQRARHTMLGQGEDTQPADRTIAAVEAAKAAGELAHPGGDHGNQYTGGKRQTDNISLPKHGTGQTYTLRRLLRDRPDLFERVESGELSANRAAISTKQKSPETQTRRKHRT